MYFLSCVQKLFFLRNVKILLLILFFGISLLSFIFTPFTGDVNVFIASAQQADYIDNNWIVNAFRQWELKGVFLRTFFYVLYKALSPFFSVGSQSFTISTNFIFCLLTCSLITFSAFYGMENSQKSTAIKFSLISSTLIFCSSPSCHLQAEMIAVVLLLSAFFMYMNVLRTRKFSTPKLLLIGFMISSIFFFKSVLLLLSISFAAAMLLFRRDRSFKEVIAHIVSVACGALVMTLIMLWITYLINPEEIQEMLNAAVYQQTLFSSVAYCNPVRIIYFFLHNGIEASIAVAGILPGAVLLIKILIRDFSEKKFESLFGHIVLWSVPFFIIALGNNFFVYHYFIFLFPVAVELLLLTQQQSNPGLSDKKFLYLTIATLAVYIAGCCVKDYNQRIFLVIIFSPSIIFLIREIVADFRGAGEVPCLSFPMIIIIVALNYLNFFSIFSANFQIYARNTKNMYVMNSAVKKQIPSDEIIMYLDDGTGAFILGNKSFLKEFYPLPLQRLDLRKEYHHLQCYRNAKQKALLFSGNYIVLYDEWFFGDNKNLEIKKKILKEYSLWTELAAYSIPFDMFSKKIDEGMARLQIYKRKQK